MDKIISAFTVYFENPFWVGVFECEYGGVYETARIVFGAEPKDNEVYEFILKNWNKIRVNTAQLTERKKHKQPSPKRLQREIRRRLDGCGAGTKSQQALKAAYEDAKAENRHRRREKLEEERERRFEMRQLKKKEKHKGH